MAIYIMCKHLRLKDPQKFTQIRLFGLKIGHLATLICSSTLNKINEVTPDPAIVRS
jgi:hypothetical protein